MENMQKMETILFPGKDSPYVVYDRTAVHSINGITPDENGDIAIELSEINLENVALKSDVERLTEEIDDLKGGSVGSAVLYTEQSLTEAQKAQARVNVGAAAEFAKTFTDVDLVWENGYYAGGHKYVSTGAWTVAQVPITPGSKIYAKAVIIGTTAELVCFFDINGEYLGGYKSPECTVIDAGNKVFSIIATAPESAAYAGMSQYAASGIAPECRVEMSWQDSVVTVSTKYFTEAQKRQARDNIGAAASEAPANTIVNRNTDMLPMVKAAVRHGWHGDGNYNIGKQLALLVTTDLHVDAVRWQSAIDYTDQTELVDFGICLGDMQGSHYSDNDGTWFADPINNATKKMYPVIGNHDAGNTASTKTSATKQQQFEKFFAPVLAKLGMTDLTKTYYSVSTEYGVTLIVLDCHDLPDDVSGESFVVNRTVPGYSQAQIDWLIDTLAAVPTDNHVLIAVHNVFDDVTLVDGVWTQKYGMTEGFTYSYVGMLPEIIDAWQNGTTLTKTYAPTVYPALPTISVNADFSGRGEGVFAGWIHGHQHRDHIAKIADFANQNVISFAATNYGAHQNKNSDLPRTYGEKTEDCVTVVAVDTVAREVKLVRIGSDITFDMVRRDMIAIPY